MSEQLDISQVSPNPLLAIHRFSSASSLFPSIHLIPGGLSDALKQEAEKEGVRGGGLSFSHMAGNNRRD